MSNDTIAAVAARVTSFAINNGATATVSRVVTLNNACAGSPTEYMASEDAGFAGFVVGAIGARLRKGWLVIIGFAVMGLATIVLGLTSNELLAVVAAVVIGIGTWTAGGAADTIRRAVGF